MDKVLHSIQSKLKSQGLDPGPLDGVWGNQTRDAIALSMGLKITRPAIVASDAADAPWLDIARTQIGVKEVPGSGNSPDVLKYFVGAQASWAKEDSIFWCAALVRWALAEA